MRLEDHSDANPVQQIREMQAELEASRAQALRLEAQNTELRGLLLHFSEARNGTTAVASSSSPQPPRPPSPPFDFHSLFPTDRASGHIPLGPIQTASGDARQSVDYSSLPSIPSADDSSLGSWSHDPSRTFPDLSPTSGSVAPNFPTNCATNFPIRSTPNVWRCCSLV